MSLLSENAEILLSCAKVSDILSIHLNFLIMGVYGHLTRQWQWFWYNSFILILSMFAINCIKLFKVEYVWLPFILLQVCNHPELFERRDTTSPLYFTLPPIHLPKLVYRDSLLDSDLLRKHQLLHEQLSIWNPLHIHNDICHGENTWF